jgi:hypothetical protein
LNRAGRFTAGFKLAADLLLLRLTLELRQCSDGFSEMSIIPAPFNYGDAECEQVRRCARPLLFLEFFYADAADRSSAAA